MSWWAARVRSRAGPQAQGSGLWAPAAGERVTEKKGRRGESLNEPCPCQGACGLCHPRRTEPCPQLPAPPGLESPCAAGASRSPQGGSPCDCPRSAPAGRGGRWGCQSGESCFSPFSGPPHLSPLVGYLALTGSSLDVHSQGVGYWEASVIVEGHKVEGGCQAVVHKHRDRGQGRPGLSTHRHDLAPGQDLGKSGPLFTAHPQRRNHSPPEGALLREPLPAPCPPALLQSPVHAHHVVVMREAGPADPHGL